MTRFLRLTASPVTLARSMFCILRRVLPQRFSRRIETVRSVQQPGNHSMLHCVPPVKDKPQKALP